jgi:cell division protein FtsI/penicillin-binding protein 2
LLLLYVAFCASMGVVWLRTAQMIVLDGERWRARAETLRQRPESLDALRGPIVSADGVVLAEDVSVFQIAVVGWAWQHRERARCPACGLVHFPGASGKLPRRCACVLRPGGADTRGGDAYPRAGSARPGPLLERLPDGDVTPLERALKVEPGTIAQRALDRIGEIERIVRDYRATLLRRGEDSDFLIDDKVELRQRDLMLRPFVLFPDVPEAAVRLVETDETGRYRGVGVQTALRRRYPLGDFAPQLLGFVSQIRSEAELEELEDRYGADQVMLSTRVGRAGLERWFNGRLHGRPGRRVLALEPRGSFTRVVEDVPPEPGRPLRLTLSAEATRAAERILEEFATPQGYLPGGRPSAAFVMFDADTGEILVWAEAPRYDNNDDLDELYDKTLTEAIPHRLERIWMPRHPLAPGLTREAWRQMLVKPVPLALSRVSQVAVEPGSTMKPLIALGLLEAGGALPYEGMFCSPGGREKPGCHGCGRVDLELAIAHSCNKFFAFSLRDAPSWGRNRFFVAKLLRDLGLGRTPNEEMVGSASGQWLWDWLDFPLEDAVRSAEKRLARTMKAAAPSISLRRHPRVPATVGGDPERLGRTLAAVAGHVAARTGTRKVSVYVTQEAREGRQVSLRFGVRAAGRPPWFALPAGETRASALPATLRHRGPRRAGVDGTLARGGTVWFTARFDRRMGRASPAQPLVIRPDDGRNVAIGQGPVLTTPLQMARAIAVFANGGLRVTPHLVRMPGIGQAPKNLRLSQASIERVRSGMYDVVNSARGTARKAAWNAVPASVFGKTGTSQVGGPWRPWVPEDPELEGAPWHHWFVGFAEQPGRRRVAFACVLHARTEAAAGLTAAKATARILTAWYRSPLSLSGSP